MDEISDADMANGRRVVELAAVLGAMTRRSAVVSATLSEPRSDSTLNDVTGQPSSSRGVASSERTVLASSDDGGVAPPVRWGSGMLCYARYAADGLFYPARILKMDGKTRARVIYEGYDDECAWVPTDDLCERDPDDDGADVHAQARDDQATQEQEHEHESETDYEEEGSNARQAQARSRARSRHHDSSDDDQPRKRRHVTSSRPTHVVVPARSLRPYQHEGVHFLRRLFSSGTGGILGDDAGLGKTVMVSAFLSAVISEGKAKGKGKVTVLMVVPVARLSDWESELHRWGELKVAVFAAKRREQCIVREDDNLDGDRICIDNT